MAAVDPFRTVLKLPEYPFSIGYEDTVLCVGSCFAEHIGSRLQQHKWHCGVNPTGILFNPVSLGRTLSDFAAQQHYAAAELVQHQGLWHSLHHHSRCSHPDPGTALALINDGTSSGHHYWLAANRLLLTLGTARVFTHKDSRTVVANCHRLPAEIFERRRLSPHEVAAALAPALEAWLAVSPQRQVVLTVSPVRHLRDGLVDNQRSKAALLLAAEALSTAFERVHYFPAYELILDDLRDYRFCEADLSHPNAMAVDYVWQRFGEAFFAGQTQLVLQEVAHIVRAAQHRPFFPGTAQHQAFAAQQLARIAHLEALQPGLDFHAEQMQFASTLPDSE